MLALYAFSLIPLAFLLHQLIEVIRDQQPPGKHEHGENSIPARDLLVRLSAATMRAYPGPQVVANRG